MQHPPSPAPGDTIEELLLRKCGLVITCRTAGCGHKDFWSGAVMVQRLGRRGLGARAADLAPRLKCSACDGRDIELDVRGDPHGYGSMNYEGMEGRRRALGPWLDKLLGPAGEATSSGVLRREDVSPPMQETPGARPGVRRSGGSAVAG